MRSNLKKLIWVLLVMEIVLALLTYVAFMAHATEIREYRLTTLIEVINKGEAPLDPKVIELHAISLFLNLSWQQTFLKEVIVNGSAVNYVLDKDIDGNPIIIIKLPIIPPKGRLRIEYEQRIIEYYPREKFLKDMHLLSYAKEGNLWQVNDTVLRSIADSIRKKAKSDKELVLSTIEWIRNNIRYGSRIPPRYPREVIEERTGDCDEQALLLGTLCRIFGIKSILRVGCIFRPGTYRRDTFLEGHVTLESVNIGWHAWARVFIKEDGWIPVDLTYYQPRRGSPLDNIEGAAINFRGTLVLATISQQDYIAEIKRIGQVLKEFNIFIFERDELSLIKVKVGIIWSEKLKVLVAITAIIALIEIVLAIKMKVIKRA